MEYRLVLVGDEGVGKRAIWTRYQMNTFKEDYEPNIDDVCYKQLVVDDISCLTNIHDAAPIKDDFNQAMFDQAAQHGHGFILAYSITSRSSFEELKKYIDQIEKVRNPAPPASIPMILCGCKCDLEAERHVTVEEGREKAKSMGIPFLESSSKDAINIDEMFKELIREIRKKSPPPPEDEKPSKQKCSIM